MRPPPHSPGPDARERASWSRTRPPRLAASGGRVASEHDAPPRPADGPRVPVRMTGAARAAGGGERRAAASGAAGRDRGQEPATGGRMTLAGTRPAPRGWERSDHRKPRRGCRGDWDRGRGRLGPAVGSDATGGGGGTRPGWPRTSGRMPLAGMDDGATCWGRMAPPRPLAGTERRRSELGQDGPASDFGRPWMSGRPFG